MFVTNIQKLFYVAAEVEDRNTNATRTSTKLNHTLCVVMAYPYFGFNPINAFYSRITSKSISYQLIKAFVPEMMSTLSSNEEIQSRKFLAVAADVFVSSAFAMPSQVVTGVPGTSQERQHRLWDVALPETAYHVQD